MATGDQRPSMTRATEAALVGASCGLIFYGFAAQSVFFFGLGLASFFASYHWTGGKSEVTQDQSTYCNGP